MIRLLSALNGTSSVPSPSYVMTQLRGASDAFSAISTRTSSHIESARPMTSKPGPILAEEQGTSGSCISKSIAMGGCAGSDLW